MPHARRSALAVLSVAAALVSTLTLTSVEPALAQTQPPPLEGPTSATGEYTPVTPTRILDTRTGTGRGGTVAPVGEKQVIDVAVTGVGGVPAANVSAVVINVTITNSTLGGFLTIWPSGAAQPLASNINFVPGQTVANLATVAVGSGGRVAVFNHGGTVDVIFDVVGSYASPGGTAGSRFHSLSPRRILDTRNGTGASGPVGNHSSIKLTVAGAGIPSNITAVTINVTAADTTADGYATVYPDDVSVPLASNLNFGSGQVVPNLVIVRVPANGTIDFYNQNGTTHFVADLVGYYDNDRSSESSRFYPLAPARIMDTRVFPGAVPPNFSYRIAVAGYGGVPANGVGAVVMNVTVTQPSAAGYVTLYPDGTSPPLASNLNFVPGQTVANLAAVKVASGAVDVYNFMGFTDVIADVAGYFSQISFAFDTCEAPPTSSMAAWRASSPYAAIGVYIGGGLRACPNTAFETPTWVSTVVSQGWRLLPLYVGLQAPCTNFLYRINPVNAVSAGQVAADDAVNQANKSGISPGAPIYFDLEGYPTTDLPASDPNHCVYSAAVNSQAVKDFLRGWVTQLHARGFRAGLYSSLDSGIRDEVAAALAGDVAVDAVWIALWNGTPNLFGFPSPQLPDTVFVNHQRIHQYQGGHNETWGGVTMNVDTSVVDAPTYP
jgi:hypothetical protein